MVRADGKLRHRSSVPPWQGQCAARCFELFAGVTNSLMRLRVQSTLVKQIKVAQSGDAFLQRCRELVTAGLRPDFVVHEDGSLQFGSRICVLEGDVREELLREAHNSQYSIHPIGTKMYKDLKLNFWWHGMKRDVAHSVTKCLVYHQVKEEHQRIVGLLQPLPIPEWKWQHITIDFVIGLPWSTRQNDVVWVIVDRLTK
ncbi:uncharacterized protein LOC109826699 [Asparagus officinalis]|uniref:uncharacterized protein LOC109826699 n=1 Tax=Asparagus officinalis TaxID=4686 RepID=UPI00098E45BF|nr:uncharacterized protein LOC109826699 [Asparagus officinalis]